MKNQEKIKFLKRITVSLALLALFALWTVAVKVIDVRAIGPRASEVGFATLNGLFHSVTGVNFTLYIITDWAGLVPVAVCLCFAILGLYQLIRRKSLLEVDGSILVLGVFYIAVMAVYVFFEYVVINYRPVLISGYLEASYPSSTTMLVLCVMPTAMMQMRERIRAGRLLRCVSIVSVVFIAFTVGGRIISGVHWLSDIVGGALLSAGLVMGYYAFSEKIKNRG